MGMQGRWGGPPARCRRAPASWRASSPPIYIAHRPPLQVNHSDAIHEGLLRFNRRWLSDFAADSVLVFSSGRSPQLFRELAVRGGVRGFAGEATKV